MTSNKNIAIIYDSNNFIPSEKKIFDLTGLNLEEYYKLENTIKLNNLQDRVKLFFPEIVLSELIINHERLLKNKIGNLKSLKDSFNNLEAIVIDGIDKIDVKNYCDTLKQNYLENLNIIPTPKDKSKLFDDILTMALNRYPPFIKKDNNKNDSDKGFKDAILFLSVLEYSNSCDFDEYIIVSNDPGFIKGQKGLQSNFKYHNNGHSELKVKKNDEITQYILGEYELFRELIEYLNKTFYYEVEDNYNCNTHVNVDFDVPMSNFEIITDYTKIYEIEENEFEVTLFIQINVDYLDEYIYVKEDISQEETYIIKKKGEKWEYELTYRVHEIF